MRHSLIALLCLTASLQADPVRVLSLDPEGKAQTEAGALHDAMRDLGRDAIWFDYAKEKVDAPYDVTSNPSKRPCAPSKSSSPPTKARHQAARSFI